MITLRARWLFPVDRPLIDDGVVVIRHDRIDSVERYCGQATTTDLGNSAIVPGLVNAHAHLEFSDLKRPLGRQGMPFADWIRAVIDYRTRVQSAPDSLAELRWPFARPVEEGLRESLAGGTTAIGDIAIAPPTADLSAADVTAFLELRAIRQLDVDDQVSAAVAFLRLPSNYRKGLSPHAPYTVHPELLARAIGLCRLRNVPVAMHVSESCEEIELLRTGGGPLRDLLIERGAWEDGVFASSTKPLAYLQQLAAAPRSLVIHGNYLDDEEIDFLAANRERMSVVYCPRTHAYFGHPAHPWRKLQARGVNVAIGTDSKASNPDLSMLEEMRFLVNRSGAAPEEALRLATICGAKALGIENKCGSLTPGKAATLVQIQLANDARGNPYEQLLHPKSHPVLVISRGQFALPPRCGLS